MKKLLCLTALLTQLVTTTFTQENSLQASAFPRFKNTIARSELKISAMRNFKKQFPDANETWSAKQDGYRARFTQDNIKHIVDYDQKGKWASTIRVYDESDLNASLVKIVKPTYFDYTIVKVIEVKIGKTLVHFIKLKNNTSLVTLHIINGELTEVENYFNAGTSR